MNFCHIYDVMRYAEDFSWTWLQCRIVSREFLGVVKRAMLDRIIEVGCGGERHITSFMLVCMINMPWCLPTLEQVCSEDVWKIVDALCIRVAPRNALLETGVAVPVLLSNDTRDNKYIVICLGKLAEGTGYRKAIDALLDCVEIREEVDALTGITNIRLVADLAMILVEGYKCEEVAFALVDMVASGHRALSDVVLGRATTFGCARNVSRFLFSGWSVTLVD